MTDDLKERLRTNLYYSWGDESDVGEQALSYITDLEARLAAAEAGEDALAKVTDAYKEMLATVEGECPSLVNEDSGASQVLLNLMLAAERAIAAYDARRGK